MKFLKNYTRFLEALDPSQFREYMKVWDENPELRTRYESIFKKYEGDKNHYRIYIPLITNDDFEEEREESEVEEGLAEFLSDYEYSIVDYMKGTCKKEGARNTSKIGQVLTRIERENPEAKGYMKDFIEDPVRKVGGIADKLVVISRHPYDIAGADTDRGWSNCMTLANYNPVKANPIYDEMNVLNKEMFALKAQIHKIRTKRSSTRNDGESDRLRNEMSTLQTQVNTLSDKHYKLQNKLNALTSQGQNAHYLIEDVKEGSLIAYLVKSTDKDVKNPIANLNIKPYINQINEKDFVLVSDSSMYGQGSKRFKATVDAWLDEVNVDKKGLYCINPNIYDDSDYGVVRKNISKEEEGRMLNDALAGGEISFSLLKSIGLLDDEDKWNNLENDLKYDLIAKIIDKADEIKNDLEDGDYGYWSDTIWILIKQSLGSKNSAMIKTILELANDDGCDIHDIMYDIIFPSDDFGDNPALVEAVIEYYGGLDDFLSDTDIISNGSNEVFYELIKNINTKDFKRIGIKLIEDEGGDGYYLYLNSVAWTDEALRQKDSDDADYTLSDDFNNDDCESIFRLYKKRRAKLVEKAAKVKKPKKNKE